ncbi:MFS transporter [Paenibacillus sp. GYB004]|uniref:MFS transporter n=1 Tax=Paenibacillus sp. GYB004 TaxID=2994393 RepID=UPI002F963A6B
MAKIRFSSFFSVFVAMVGLMIIAPVMPPIIREMGLSETHSGLIISLGSVAMALMARVWGIWSDVKGRKTIILVGFLGMFVSYVLFTATIYAGLNLLVGSMVLLLFFVNLAVYFLAYFLFGIGAGLMMPGFMAGASLAVSREQQGGVAGLVGSVQGISAVIALILSTTLYQLDKHIPYAVIAGLVVCMAIVLFAGSVRAAERPQSLEK